MVPRLDRGDVVPDGFDGAGPFMAKDDGKGALGVLTGERICV